jgi:hypothetical protein
VSSTEELKVLLQEEPFKMKTEGLANRAQVANIVVAWETAKVRGDEQKKQDGESEVRNIPKHLPSDTFTSIVESFEVAWCKGKELPEKKTPARCYMEKRLDDIENNLLKPEGLDEVLNVTQDDSQSFRPVWDDAGNMKTIKTVHKISMPANKEEFRTRITLMGSAWIMAGLHQTHGEYLKGIDPSLFSDYLEYMLGEYVGDLDSKDQWGTVISKPPWYLILAYDHAIRKETLKRVKRTSMTFEDAFRQTWEDPVVMARNFTTPWQSL